jgi:hypothetical protein
METVATITVHPAEESQVNLVDEVEAYADGLYSFLIECVPNSVVALAVAKASETLAATNAAVSEVATLLAMLGFATDGKQGTPQIEDIRLVLAEHTLSTKDVNLILKDAIEAASE